MKNKVLKGGVGLILFGSLHLHSFAAEIPVPTKRPQKTEIEAAPQPSAKFGPTSSDASGQSVPNEQIESKDDSAEIQCRQALLQAEVKFEILPNISGESGCGLQSPINVSEIAPGVTLKPETQFNCAMALATSKWVGQVVIPALAASFPERKLSSIRQASTYVCRPRNNIKGGKLSEHAIGNAIDIAAFEFETGNPIIVMPRQRTGQSEEAFQKAVRFGACTYFTTVLGPYSDPYHSDHLHFDLANRRGGYKLCDFPDLPSNKTGETEKAKAD